MDIPPAATTDRFRKSVMVPRQYDISDDDSDLNSEEEERKVRFADYIQYRWDASPRSFHHHADVLCETSISVRLDHGFVS